jgi:hypothetical protein
MIEGVKRTWADLMRSEPGRRFQDRNERQHAGRKWDRARVLKLALGFGLIVPGIIMIPFPGPGAVIVILGLALIADEFKPVARFLDRAELSLRGAYGQLWGKAPTTQRVAVIFISLAVGALLCYGAYRILLGRS